MPRIGGFVGIADKHFKCSGPRPAKTGAGRWRAQAVADKSREGRAV